MPDAPALRSLQSWMQAVIRDPRGAEAALVSEEAQGYLGKAAPREVVGGSPRLSAIDRLELYNRQFRSRMLSCLRQTYPALGHALGAELFDEFALAYVNERPSRSYTLHALRDGFAAYLKDTQGEMTGPDHSWADFVVDLAELERRFHVVYDGPGMEREPVRNTSLPPAERWADTTIEPHPSLHLMRARFPIGPYFHSARRHEEPAMPRAGASFIALTRRDYAVVIVELDAARYGALERLRAGRSLDAVSTPVSRDVLRKWLREWIDKSLIVGVHSPRAAGEGDAVVDEKRSEVPAAGSSAP